MMLDIRIGDMLNELESFPENSIDAGVTDPPYHLTSIVKRFGAESAAPAQSKQSGVYARSSKGFMGQVWDGGDIAFRPETWAKVLRVLKPGAHLLAFSASKNAHRLACAIEDAGFEIRDTIMWIYGSGFPKSHNGDGEWKGWGTALKPAYEPIVLARKPLVGTIKQNVAGFGTGALNIDASRVGGEGGRWPANVIHDGSDEVLVRFPHTKSGKPSGVKAGNNNNIYGQYEGGIPVTGFGDEGNASRFFYCAKATREDREEGLAGFEPTTTDGRKKPIDNAFQRGETLRKNDHPTVKPTNLMRYLCRLITPQGGVILDPFMGSGSTGKAAMLEGFRFIGIEMSAGYSAIAKARIESVMPEYLQ